MWRLTNDAPHYSRANSGDEEGRTSSYGSGWRLFGLFLSGGSDKSGSGREDRVHSLEESPDGRLLASLHLSGDICVWQLPSLRIWQRMRLEEQPGHDDIHPGLLQNPRQKRKKQKFLKDPLRCEKSSLIFQLSPVIARKCQRQKPIQCILFFGNPGIIFF